MPLSPIRRLRERHLPAAAALLAATMVLAGLAGAAAGLLRGWLQSRARQEGTVAAHPEPARTPPPPPPVSLARQPAAAVPLAAPPPESGAPGASAEPAPEEPAASTEELAEEVKRLARDLEYNAELPEPPQQLVVRPPRAWAPGRDEGLAAAPVIEEIAPEVASPAGGTQVAIRGRHLRVAQVMIGATPARVLSADEELVIVVAPAGTAGPATIALTNQDGSYALAAQPFAYGAIGRAPPQ